MFVHFSPMLFLTETSKTTLLHYETGFEMVTLSFQNCIYKWAGSEWYYLLIYLLVYLLIYVYILHRAEENVTPTTAASTMVGETPLPSAGFCQPSRAELTSATLVSYSFVFAMFLSCQKSTDKVICGLCTVIEFIVCSLEAYHGKASQKASRKKINNF